MTVLSVTLLNWEARWDTSAVTSGGCQGDRTPHTPWRTLAPVQREQEQDLCVCKECGRTNTSAGSFCASVSKRCYVQIKNYTDIF